jgi:hypothetical protein
MHAHCKRDLSFYNEFGIPLFLANVITGIRIMWGSKAEVLMRDSIERNLLIAPRLVVSTPIVDGPFPAHDGTLPISNESRVPIVVDSLKALGYDFLKVYSKMPRDLFFALATYCRQKNFPIAGHVPFGVTIQEASAAGLRSIEHSTGLNKSFSDKDEQLSRQWEKEAKDTSGFMAYLDIFDKAEISDAPFNRSKAKKVSATLIANRTAVVPTVIVWSGYTMNRDSLMKIPALAYVSKAQQQQWYNFRGMASLGKNYSIYNKLEQINFLNKQGVLILAGSDCLNPFTVPGFSLHDELELLVKAGLTHLQALRTATLNPAIFLNKEKELGTVSKDKMADLVILERDPLTDIKNTRSIHAVVMNGNLIDKSRINKFIEQIKERASK